MNTANDKADQLLILGLGNEYLGDDAVGILAVRELIRTLPARNGLVFQEVIPAISTVFRKATFLLEAPCRRPTT
jgi:Ni,Fe-hydrogenase maturation factor